MFKKQKRQPVWHLKNFLYILQSSGEEEDLGSVYQGIFGGKKKKGTIVEQEVCSV